jgi:CubicO group peptidase (beta-lactamase class C family)
MKRLLFALITAMVMTQGLAAQSGERPAPVFDASVQVDKLFSQWNRPDSPGCAISVIRDGHIVYEHGYGMADLDHDIPITPKTVFHVASISKQFTAAAIVLLAEKGRLSLNDEVHRYIPELPDFGVPITIRHLIHHTSGLYDQWGLLRLVGWRYSLDLITDDDVLSVISKEKRLQFRPGEKFDYSNTGYTLLAIIVKRLAGQSLREFTRSELFEPLEMYHSHFRDNHAEIVKGQAYGYDQRENGPWRLSVTNFDTVGATSLLTTVEDIARWDENFYDPRVGGRAMIEQLLEPGKLNNGEVLEYAFGNFVSKYRGLPTVEHAGVDAGYRAELIRFPEQHFSTVILCNSAVASPRSLGRRVADIYLEKEFKEPPVPYPPFRSVNIPESQLSAKVGLYWDSDGDDFQRVSLKNGKLLLFSEGETQEMVPLSESHFRLAEDPSSDLTDIEFKADKLGKPSALVESFIYGKPDVYEMVPEVAPTSDDLNKYAGSYKSEEIDPIYTLAVEGGKLFLRRPKYGADVLLPIVYDTFVASIGTIRFNRGPGKRISGFTLNGRIVGIQFQKMDGQPNPMK